MTKPAKAIERFQQYLQRRHYAAHTIVSYTFDLQLFFADRPRRVELVTHQDVEQFLSRQHEQGLAATTVTSPSSSRSPKRPSAHPAAASSRNNPASRNVDSVGIGKWQVTQAAYLGFRDA